MKKLLLMIVTLAFVAACGGSKTADVDVPAELTQYEGACADIAFHDTRLKLKEVDDLLSKGHTSEANFERDEAAKLYNAGLLTYNDLKSSTDRISADMANQKSRLAAIKDDAQKVAPKDYSNSVKKIGALHKDAQSNIDKCNVAGAEVAVAGAEKELSRLEALVASRMNKSTPVSFTTYVVKKGDSLWRIASDKLSNPYFWPLIYWSNKDTIKDPDLIYPNQKLKVENNYDNTKRAQAEKFAKTRGAWSLYDNK